MRIKVFKIGKFLTSVSVICIILVTTLHISSNNFKYSIFKDPGDLEDWQDHIQIIILLKGNIVYSIIYSFFTRVDLLSFIFHKLNE